MSHPSKKVIQKTFTRQHDQQDCGVACLLSLVRYYGGDSSLERIREWSGTSKQGTSLLGLYQAAVSLGFTAEGCEADIDSLIAHGEPVILHLLTEGNIPHYVICYGYENGSFVVGDPAKGVERYTSEKLEAQWASHACLLATPSDNFIRKESVQQQKRSWIKALVKEDRGLLIISLLIGAIVAALGMAMAVFSQKLIDNILPSKDYVRLWSALAIFAILMLVQITLSVVRQHLLLRQSKDFNNRIIGDFYSRLLFLPKVFFDTRKVGDMTARLNDTRRIQGFISQTLGATAINVLSIFVSLILLFSYSLPLALVVSCSLPLYFFIVYRYNKPIMLKQREAMAGYAQSESNFISTIQGISTIKNFNKQTAFSDLNRYIYGFFQDRIYSLGNINIALGWKSGIVGVFILLLLLAFGSYYVFADSLTLGRLMAILSISSSLLPGIASLALVAIPFNEAKIAFDRMFEFAGLKAEDSLQEENGKAIFHFESLKINDLKFRFPGQKQLLRGIGLHLQKNEIISIAGESGCGKSTFCQILEKFYDYEAGEIIINESLSFKDFPTMQWREYLGVVSQEIFIFNGSVLDNICLNDTQVNPQDIIDFCTQYGFDGFINELPQSYATLVGEEGINLSGGQKQIIALARALYKNPQILILDEATAAMDRNTEQFTLQLLLRLKDKMSIIFVSHRLHVLRLISDRIYLFEKGTIAASGTHEYLIQSNNLYSDYWKDFKK